MGARRGERGVTVVYAHRFTPEDERRKRSTGLTGRTAVTCMGVRRYLWAATQPVDPLDIARHDDGTTAVEVHQVVVHDHQGALLKEKTGHLVFRM